MSFPSNWLQIWVGMPSDHYYKYPAMLLWLDGTSLTAPPGFDVYQLESDFWSWWAGGIGPKMRCYPSGTNYQYAFAWIGFYATTYAVEWNLGPTIPYGVDLLPAKTNICIRRTTNVYVRGAGSVLRVPGIEASDVDGSYLTPSAFSSWSAAAQGLMASFTSQGVTYRPIIPFYSRGSFRQAQHVRVSQKLGTIRRRGNLFARAHPFLNPAKSFP
jgi:hypothetical protein